MKRNSFLILFTLAGLATILSNLNGMGNVQYWSKPLLMTFLAGYYIAKTTSEERSLSVLVALAFSFLGDSFLMFEQVDQLYFMLGLGSFLLAHLTYIIAYKHHVHASDGDELTGLRRVRLAFPIILAGSGLLIVLFPHLGDLKLPVVIYAVILMLMVLNALFRYNRTSSESFWFVFCGAVLFMVSDSLLALNKFLRPLPFAGIGIITTYIAAQFLIVEGLIRHPKK
jgi:uncharacterized membrane protein YhhN